MKLELSNEEIRLLDAFFPERDEGGARIFQLVEAWEHVSRRVATDHVHCHPAEWMNWLDYRKAIERVTSGAPPPLAAKLEAAVVPLDRAFWERTRPSKRPPDWVRSFEPPLHALVSRLPLGFHPGNKEFLEYIRQNDLL